MTNLELEELSVHEMKEKDGGGLFLAMGLCGAIRAGIFWYGQYQEAKS